MRSSWTLQKPPSGLVEPYESGEEACELGLQLEHPGVPVINPSSAIEAVKDKLYAHQLLAQRNLPLPRTYWCGSRSIHSWWPIRSAFPAWSSCWWGLSAVFSA